MREEKRLLPVRGPRAQQTLSDPARLAPTVPGGCRQPWKGGLRSSTRPRVEEVCVRQEAQGCRCLSRGGGGGEGAVAFSLFSGLSCVSPDFSDGYMWLAKLDLEINARYCISICM